MKLIYILIIGLIVCGCAPDPGLPQDEYGYHYTHTTPMGIKYRVDDGGAPLDAGMIDYYFSSVINCVGQPFNPENLLIISTIKDVNHNIIQPVEGWTWQPNDTNPARIVLNITEMSWGAGWILSHELVHVFVKQDSHDSESFNRCGYKYY